MKKLFYSVLAGLLLLPSVAFAALGTLADNENNKFVLNSAGSVAVRVTTSGGNITMSDDSWIGLGAAAGRLIFDSTPTPDLLTFADCTVAISGLTATRVLYAGTGGAISDDAGFTFTAASDLLTLGEGGQSGSLALYSEVGGTDYTVTFNPSASMTMNTTYTLPVDDGTTGQVLSTNGSGVLSWTASIPGSPAGSDTQVQYNNGGTAFGADAGFTYAAASDTLTLGENGQDGVLTLYSEQGGTDYSVTLNPNAAMASAAAFYLPADEPASTGVMTVTTGGVLTIETASAGLLGALSDETGTGVAVFNDSPTFADNIQLGLAGTSGQLKIYSEQGGTDFTATLNPNAAMASDANFYLPADEPASTLPLTMTTGGVIGFNDQAVAVASAPTFANLTDSGITATHIVYGGTAGLLSGSAIWTYDSGNVTMGNASANGGVFSMIQGAVASDPTFSITQATNDVTIAQTVGDITLNPAGNDVHLGLDDDAVNLAIHSSGTFTMYEASDDFSASMNCKDGAAELVINDDLNLGADDAGENLYIHSAGTLNVYEASDDYSAVAVCKDGAAEWQFNDDVNIGAAADAENLYIHNAGTLNVYEADNSFTASAQCKDGAAEWLFNDDVNVGGASDAENLYVHNGGTIQAMSAGDDKNVQISHDDTDGTVASSSGELNLTGSLIDLDANSNSAALRIRGTDAGNEYADFYITASNDLVIDSTGGTIFADEFTGYYFATQLSHMEIGDYLDALTAPKVIYGVTGTCANTSTETGYEDAAGLTWTYNGTAVGDKSYKGSTWVVDLAGDGYVSTPDDASITFALAAASWGAWVNITDTAGVADTIISKYDASTGAEIREYIIYKDDAEKLLIELWDETNNAYSFRKTDAAVAVGWHFIVVTYDGAANAAGTKFYVDGALVASTATEDQGGGAFDSMRDTAAPGWIGAYENASGAAAGFWTSRIGRIFITGEELSAATIWKLYEQARGYYDN